MEIPNVHSPSENPVTHQGLRSGGFCGVFPDSDFFNEVLVEKNFMTTTLLLFVFSLITFKT